MRQIMIAAVSIVVGFASRLAAEPPRHMEKPGGFSWVPPMGWKLSDPAKETDAAMKTILAAKPWTPPQRKWLERIGKQLETETEEWEKINTAIAKVLRFA